MSRQENGLGTPTMLGIKELLEQVTRDHNIVADGWAGASNPHPYPNPQPTHKHTQKVSKTLVFPLFDSWVTDQRTDGPTDRPMDQLTDHHSELYRVA